MIAINAVNKVTTMKIISLMSSSSSSWMSSKISSGPNIGGVLLSILSKSIRSISSISKYSFNLAIILSFYQCVIVLQATDILVRGFVLP